MDSSIRCRSGRILEIKAPYMLRDIGLKKGVRKAKYLEGCPDLNRTLEKEDILLDPRSTWPNFTDLKNRVFTIQKYNFIYMCTM